MLVMLLLGLLLMLLLGLLPGLLWLLLPMLLGLLLGLLVLLLHTKPKRAGWLSTSSLENNENSFDYLLPVPVQMTGTVITDLITEPSTHGPIHFDRSRHW